MAVLGQEKRKQAVTKDLLGVLNKSKARIKYRHFCLGSGENMNESDLEFDPYSGEENEENYSSLTDVNDISVFTDEFEENAASLIRQEHEKIQNLYGRIFLYDMAETQSDQYIRNGLFQEEHQQIIRTENTEESENGVGFIGIGMIIVLFLWVLTAYIQTRKAKREVMKNSVGKMVWYEREGEKYGK